jgi:signal transduction histidine kinase
LPDFHLGTDLRREIYLVFKECVNNLAKHSEATKTKIVIESENNNFVFILEDNGKGFDVAQSMNAYDGMGGNGLVNMKRRTEDLSGEFLIDSNIGSGTKVTFKVPFERQNWVKNLKSVITVKSNQK